MGGGPLPQHHPELVEHLLDLSEVDDLEGRQQGREVGLQAAQDRGCVYG